MKWMTDLYEILDTIRRIVPEPIGHDIAEMMLHYSEGIALTPAERSQLLAWRENAVR